MFYLLRNVLRKKGIEMKAFFKVAMFVVSVFIACHLVVCWVEKHLKEDWAKYKAKKGK